MPQLDSFEPLVHFLPSFHWSECNSNLCGGKICRRCCVWIYPKPEFYSFNFSFGLFVLVSHLKSKLICSQSQHCCLQCFCREEKRSGAEKWARHFIKTKQTRTNTNKNLPTCSIATNDDKNNKALCDKWQFIKCHKIIELNSPLFLFIYFSRQFLIQPPLKLKSNISRFLVLSWFRTAYITKVKFLAIRYSYSQLLKIWDILVHMDNTAWK